MTKSLFVICIKPYIASIRPTEVETVINLEIFLLFDTLVKNRNIITKHIYVIKPVLRIFSPTNDVYKSSAVKAEISEDIKKTNKVAFNKLDLI